MRGARPPYAPPEPNASAARPLLRGKPSPPSDNPLPSPPRPPFAHCSERAFPRSAFRPLRPCPWLRQAPAPTGRARLRGQWATQGYILRGGKMKRHSLRAGLSSVAAGPTSGGDNLQAPRAYPSAQGSQRPRRGPPRGALQAVGLPGANRRELRICSQERTTAKIRDCQRLRKSTDALNGHQTSPR